MNKDGTGYAVLHNFGTASNDGQNPAAALLLASDGIFYGTTPLGGSAGFGTMFKVTKTGSSYSYAVLQSFQGATGDGAMPLAPLIEGASDGFLYGMTSAGGLTDSGTLFKLRKNGTGYSLLHNFQNTGTDGQIPSAALREGSDGILYGTTEY